MDRNSKKSVLSVCAFVCASVFIFSAAVFAQDEPREITAAIPRNFPPHYSVGADGQPTGFAIDVMEAVAGRANLKINYRIEENWAEVNNALLQGRAGLIPNLGITEERAEYFDFTTPVETFNISVFVRRGTHAEDPIEFIKGKRVGVVETNAAVEIIKNIPEAEAVVYASPEEAFFNLISGNVDALAYPEPVTYKIARQAGLESAVAALEPPLREIKRAIAVSKGNDELLGRLNAVLEDFVNSSEYQAIYSKWYAEKPGFWTERNAIIVIVSGIIGLLFGGLVILSFYSSRNRRLKVREEKAAKKAKKSLRETKQAMQALEEIDRMKDEFIDIASHQLRTPLTSISWYLESLLNGDSGKLTKAQLRYAELAQAGAKRMNNLINDLLNISRLESKRVRIKPEPVSLEKLIKEQIEEVEAATKKHQCEIIYIKPEKKLSKIKIDRALLRQVLCNLIENAIRFSRGKKCRVKIRLEEKGKFFQVSVKDSGIGIPEADHDNIFNKFFRARNAVKKSPGGTGLGLYICKLIINTLGGKIWFESAVKKGTTFYFTIPKAGIRPRPGKIGLV